MTDAQLLEQYVARHDSGADDSFEALMDRHGPMVLETCRVVLGDEHAAEDAFQATFLVLARKAGSIWVKDSLASWLQGVALRVALKARSDAIKRRRHERHVAERQGKTTQTYAESNNSRSDAQMVIHEERSNADPFPGVVIVYGTDAEDGYAIRQSVVAPGKAVTFRLLDIWNESNRGHFSLSVTEEKTSQISPPNQSAK